ncbi:unnamed protein product [Ilex paraguariensis]
MESFKDKNLSSGLFFLELLSAVEPRVVNWNLVTKGESDDEKKLNATYIISVARKLGCSIFLLPEDIMQVNQKMMLTLTAGIMYWSLQQQVEESESSLSPATATTPDASPAPSIDGEDESSLSPFPAIAAASPDASPAPSVNGEDEKSIVGESSLGEVSNLTLDDAASDTTVSSEVENKDTPQHIEP